MYYNLDILSTAIGALIGAVFGGVGAAPGAALGFEIGLQIVELYGLAMLAQWLAQSLTGIGSAFGSFISQIWDANGDEKKLKAAAVTLADAIAKLVGFLLETLAAHIIVKGAKALLNTKFVKTVGEKPFAKWTSERVANQQARRNTAINTVVEKVKPKKSEAPTTKPEPKTAVGTRAEIIKQLQEKHGKAVIDTLLKQCKDNVVWLKRFLEKFETPYEVRSMLKACGDAARLNKLLNAAESRGLGIKGVYDAVAYYGKNLSELLKTSENEVSAAVELMKFEKADGGHAVTSHDPQITNAQLQNRIKTAIAPDGRVSGTHTSSRFNSVSEMLKIREYSISEFVREFNAANLTTPLDLTRPPSPSLVAANGGNPGRVMLRGIDVSTQPIIGNKSIGTSFEVPMSIRNPTKLTVPSGSATGRNAWPASSISEVTTPITKVRVALTWNGKKWVLGQFFPIP